MEELTKESVADNLPPTIGKSLQQKPSERIEDAKNKQKRRYTGFPLPELREVAQLSTNEEIATILDEMHEEQRLLRKMINEINDSKARKVLEGKE